MSETNLEPRPILKEVIIVIDDPVTGRAHLEFPEPPGADQAGIAAPKGSTQE